MIGAARMAFFGPGEARGGRGRGPSVPRGGAPRHGIVTEWLRQRSSSAVELTDRGKLCGVEGGSADQCAVDVALRHDPGDVGRLDRAAVEHAHAVGEVAAVELGQPGPDRGADLLRVGGRGHLAGADRPHRLVGHHDAGRLLRGTPIQRAVELAQRVRDLVARSADVQTLADAQDRAPGRCGRRRLDLPVHDRVVLGVVLPPLGVPDDDVGAAELGQHDAGDVAGVGAGVVRRQVLGAVDELAACRRRSGSARCAGR